MAKVWTAGKPKEEKPKTVSEMLIEIEDEICDRYCKYPEICISEREDPADAEQLLFETYCATCPLSRL